MSAAPRYPSDMGYNGLRMTADEFLALGETQERYELIDGVVVMSPSPFPDHNEIANEIVFQLVGFERAGGGVRVFADVDVRLASGKVYRPDVAVYRKQRLEGKVSHLVLPPDLAVEILSPGSKPLDLITQRDDYEQFGVAEYWVVDPQTAGVRVWRRPSAGSAGRMLEAPVEPDRVVSSALPGFVLDLGPIRRIVENT